MYSRNFLNEIFRDGFLLYNDIFAVRTRCVRRENGSSISKIQPKGFVWRRYRKYIITYSRNFLFRRFRKRIISFFCKFILFSLILLLACFIFAVLHRLLICVFLFFFLNKSTTLSVIMKELIHLLCSPFIHGIHLCQLFYRCIADFF